jgi:hypothetical protein
MADPLSAHNGETGNTGRSVASSSFKAGDFLRALFICVRRDHASDQLCGVILCCRRTTHWFQLITSLASQTPRACVTSAGRSSRRLIVFGVAQQEDQLSHGGQQNSVPQGKEDQSNESGLPQHRAEFHSECQQPGERLCGWFQVWKCDSLGSMWSAGVWVGTGNDKLD